MSESRWQCMASLEKLIIVSVLTKESQSIFKFKGFQILQDWEVGVMPGQGLCVHCVL